MPTHFERARALHRAGDLEGAVALYRLAAAEDPADFRARHNLGAALEDLGRPEEAEAAYQEAILAYPDGALSHYSLARLSHLAGRLDRAEAGYRRAVELDPGLAEAHFNLGQLLLERGEPSVAEEALRGALRADEAHAAAASLLGDALFAQARPHEALEIYRRTARLDPDSPVAQFDLGKTYETLHRTDEAVACYRRSLELEPSSTAAREGLARALEAAGRHEEALAGLREWLERDPGHPVAVHLLAAYGGREGPERASEGYVRETFDRFAPDFDATLARLDYHAHQLVVGAVALLRGEPRGDLDVLDAGCGTGLVGPLVRPWAARLEGVDLSGAMLERARRRGGYDALHQGELGAFLDAHPAAWDLIVSADTLCYFGALEGVLSAAARALRPGGGFAFTVERLAGEGGSALQSSGRYAHHEDYVRAALGACGFRATIGRGTLRMEGGVPVEGLVVAAARRDPAAPAVDATPPAV